VSVLVAEAVEKAHADRAVLRGIDLRVDVGERVGLVGPNGCGKSTLLRVLAGEAPDGGRVTATGKVAFVAQDPELPGPTVADALAPAIAWHAALKTGWEAAVAAGDLDRAGQLQSRLDHAGWDLTHAVDAALARTGAPGREAQVAVLSGGERRRVALARAMLQEPDVLLLDEPTNHLDAETVEALQGWLEAFAGAVVITTHDRYLLEAVATRIVEIEQGEAVSYDGSYGDYLITRAERQASLRKSESVRLAMIAREAAWAARSPAARTTKQRARLDRLDALQAQGRLPADVSLGFDFRTGLKQGQAVLEAKGLRVAFGDRVLVQDLDVSLLRGERLGIVGPNGAGKTTLLRVLTGERAPDGGVVRFSPKTRVATLDQHRTGLNDADTVYDAAGEGQDQVIVGDRAVHVRSFLDRFLFRREIVDQKVGLLSGGERARLLLARMMLQGATLLVLDEPTNDLDLLTLGVLEEALLGFDGSALLVTHDRAFLDRVCTAVLAFEGDGRVTRYETRQQATQAARRASEALKVEARAVEARKDASPKPQAGSRAVKLSYKDKLELAALPDRVEALEAELAALAEALNDPDVWADGRGLALQTAHDAKAAEVEAAMERWVALQELADA
jgi:ATP-binding cassette subfamily F protein uup